MATEMRDLDRLSRPAPTVPRVFISRIRGLSAAAESRAFGIKAVIEGEETYRLDDQLRIVRSGEFIVVPPGQAFEVGVARCAEAVGLCIDVPAEAVQTLASEPLHPDAVFRVSDESVGDLLTRIWRGDSGAHETPSALTRWLATHRPALTRVAARRPSTRRDLYARVERARQFLHDQRQHKVRLSDLVEVAHLSAPHLNRVFRQVHGVPPMRYHHRLRLAEAAQRLERGEVTATVLADELGYCDLPTLSRAFRRTLGAPPSAFCPKRAPPPKKRTC